MSPPRIDPNFTMEALKDSGQKLLDAAYEYFEATHKAGMSGAVIWLTDTDGKMVIFTRGEYRDQLMRNIDMIGPVRHFGCAGEAETT